MAARAQQPKMPVIGFLGLGPASASNTRVEALRAGLRSEMQHSALMDETGFARHVEAAYQGMWQAWCTEGVN